MSKITTCGSATRAIHGSSLPVGLEDPADLMANLEQALA